MLITPRSIPRKSVVGGIGAIGDIDRHQQEPLAIMAKYQVTLALCEAKPLGLVLAHDERNDHTAFEGRAS